MTVETTEKKTNEPTGETPCIPKTDTPVPALANPNASAEAVRLYSYLWEQKGRGILSGQQEFPEGCYPGDAYVDIFGCDCYSEGIHEELYEWVQTQTTKQMPLCHHENGPIPEPGLLKSRGVQWGWFLTWHTIHIHEQNSPEYLNYVYNHPYVVNLKDLPQL